jgi:hypothetical protein
MDKNLNRFGTSELTGASEDQDSTRPLRDRLKYVVDVRIPGFLTAVPPGAVRQLTFASTPTETLYREFVDNLVAKFGGGNYPVFRFSDGECLFAVGFRFPFRPPGTGILRHYVRNFLSLYVRHRAHRVFRSGGGYVPGTLEIYTPAEWDRGRPLFVKYLRYLAENGTIALNFTEEDGRPACGPYREAVCEWLDKQGIILGPHNSIPFYFVYALLLGPDRRRLLRDKRVLVVTCLTDDKRRRLENTFEREQVRSVQFLEISANKSLIEPVAVEEISGPVDLVLVGGGVGAARVQYELRHLPCVSIDAGYVLDCYADPSLRGRRYFSVPDDELNSRPPIC